MQTVYIVDDNTILCDALSHVLSADNLQVKLFDSIDEFLSSYQSQDSGCLLIDSSKFHLDIINMQTKLNQSGTTIPSIYLVNEADIPTIIKAIHLKAANVLIKPFKNALLLESLKLALDTDKDQKLKTETAKANIKYYTSLSKREKQVMQLMIDGASNKDMAQALDITLKTVEAHRAKVMKKMHINSLAKLVRTAIKYDLIESSLITE